MRRCVYIPNGKRGVLSYANAGTRARTVAAVWVRKNVKLTSLALFWVVSISMRVQYENNFDIYYYGEGFWFVTEEKKLTRRMSTHKQWQKVIDTLIYFRMVAAATLYIFTLTLNSQILDCDFVIFVLENLFPSRVEQRDEHAWTVHYSQREHVWWWNHRCQFSVF